MSGRFIPNIYRVFLVQEIKGRRRRGAGPVSSSLNSWSVRQSDCVQWAITLKIGVGRSTSQISVTELTLLPLSCAHARARAGSSSSSSGQTPPPPPFCLPNTKRRNIDGGFSEVLYSVGRARLTLPFVPTAGSLGCAGGGGSTTCVGVMTYATKHYCDLVVL